MLFIDINKDLSTDARQLGYGIYETYWGRNIRLGTIHPKKRENIEKT